MPEKTAWDEFDERVSKLGVRLLLTFGRKQLGEPDSKAEAAITGIKDPDRLHRMA